MTWRAGITREAEERRWVEPTSNSIGLGKDWKVFSVQNKISTFLNFGKPPSICWKLFKFVGALI